MRDRPVPRAFIRDRRHAQEVEAWAKRHPSDPRANSAGLELLVFDWCDHSEPLSEHGRLEVAGAHWRGRKAGAGPMPLDPGQPVPGCGCEHCTGIADAEPLRPRTTRTIADSRPALDLEAARAVPILKVAARLGIEHRRGWAVCPFHADSSPSLHLNPKKNAAFCNPCGRSWDPIALVMDYRNLPFPEAVRELAA